MLLVYYHGNWADELDVDGFKLFSNMSEFKRAFVNDVNNRLGHYDYDEDDYKADENEEEEENIGDYDVEDIDFEKWSEDIENEDIENEDIDDEEEEEEDIDEDSGPYFTFKDAMKSQSSIEIPCGSNEYIEYDTASQYFGDFSFKKITDTEADIITKFFDSDFGFFPV